MSASSNVHELYPRIGAPDGRTAFRGAEARRMLEEQGWRQAADGEWHWLPPGTDHDDGQLGARPAP